MMGTMDQLSLFDTLRTGPIRRPVDPDGRVVQGEVQKAFVLPHPRYAFPRCRIELHPSRDGLWMWSVSIHTVGEKWGQFALTRDDALHYALKELETKLARMVSPCKSVAKIRSWANSLTLEAAE